MTLTTTQTRVSYPGAGLTGPFPFPFRIFAYSDLYVVKTSAGGIKTVLAYGPDFTGTGQGDATGTITLTTALATAETVAIRRKPTITQPVDIRNQGNYYAATHEDEFDRLTMIDQSQQDELDRSFKLDETLDPSLYSLRVSAPKAGKVLVATASGIDWASLDSSATALPGASRTVTTLSAYLQNNALFNAKDYGAIADGNSHPLSGYFGSLAAAQVVYPHATALTQELDWAASQMAINQAQPVKGVAYHPIGTYSMGNDGWTAYVGSQIRGDTGYQYGTGFGIDPKGTRFNFAPTSTKDFLTVSPVGRSSGFAQHISMEGFYIHGNSVLGGATTSRYGLNVDAVIYGRFENIGIEGFQYAIRCSSTINNDFKNIWASGTVACVVYAGGNETTDSWWHCSFMGPPTGEGSPIGVQFLGSSLAIRFFAWLWEQINNYGMEIAKDCQNIEVHGAYCEDVPFTNNANGAMFRVGYTGTSLVIQNHLSVFGGMFAGRNAGTVGQFLDCDYCSGVQLIGVTHSRFTNIIRTTANTRANSIVVQGGAGISWVTYATDSTKISGTYPSGVVNSGGQIQNAIFGQVTANNVGVIGALTAANAAISSAVTNLLTLANSIAAGAGNLATIRFMHNYTNWGLSDDAYISSNPEEALNFRASLDFATSDGTGAAPTTRLRIRGAGQLQLSNLGATPANLVDGQFWYDGTNLRFRTGGVSKTVTVT
jgi:hypothetical protein